MNDKVFACLWQAIYTYHMISATYLQRKFKITRTEADRYIQEFLKREIIPLHKAILELNSKNSLGKVAEDPQNIQHKLPRQNTKTYGRGKMIVVIGGAKGGVGKSTIAINLVTMLSAYGRRVLFIDADRIKSSSKFVEHRLNKNIPTPWTTICLQNNCVSSEALKMQLQYDELVIDVGGGDTASQRHAAGIADILIMPFKPSFPDLETLEDMRFIVTMAKPYNPKLKVYALLNQADSRGVTNEQGKQILEQETFLECMKTTITNRVSIRNAWSAGLGIIEMKPADTKAVTEITNFYEEIYGPREIK